MFPRSKRKTHRDSEGFTLIEMAVVLVIAGMIIMAVFPALIASRKANQLAVTQSNLQTLMRATASFVQANGCLPCPAKPGGTRTSFGFMGYDSTATRCGACNAPQGIPPFVALGVSSSVAHDGWGHWITMRVDPALTNLANVVVPPTASCTASDVASGAYGCTTVGASVKGLCMAASSSNNSALSGVKVTSVTLSGLGATQYAAVLFLSHGSTGYGSYVATTKISDYLRPFDSRFHACNPPTNGFAQCNSAEVNSGQFYDAPIIQNDADASESAALDFYDDLLAYASRNALISMLGNGACSSEW
ncbi:MAG: type II secretion system protein [Alphaproteobacteria bacterium]|nr:type II secretion system protein [Alphaproteobacteria bacterium]